LESGPRDPERAAAGAKSFNFNTAIAIGFVVLAVLLFLVIPTQIETPLVIFGQSLNALDPKLFPRIVAAGFLILGCVYVFISPSMTDENGLAKLNREAVLNVSVSVAAFAAYAWLMEPLGFIPSSALLIGGLSIFYGLRNIAHTQAISLGIPTLMYFVFTRALKVFLPEIPEL
jgi:putative tricarboxylic transport membrane protein